MSDQNGLDEIGVSSEETRLLSAIQSLLLMPKARVAVWLQLSLLPQNLPKPHQRRVASAIMEAAANHHDGDVFSLANGDLVLLCRAPTHNGVEPAAHPTALPHTFSRLFQPNMRNPAELTRTWWLEHDGAALLANVAQCSVPA